MIDRLARPTEPVPQVQRPRNRPRFSPSATLIAGVGTLMLAMGVGVLIGRSSNSEKPSLPLQVVTVGSASGGTSASTTTPSTNSAGETSKAANPVGSNATSATSSASKKSSKSSPKSNKPQAKVVKVGSKGSGAGYNKQHKFTGEFFGEEE